MPTKLDTALSFIDAEKAKKIPLGQKNKINKYEKEAGEVFRRMNTALSGKDAVSLTREFNTSLNSDKNKEFLSALARNSGSKPSLPESKKLVDFLRQNQEKLNNAVLRKESHPAFKNEMRPRESVRRELEAEEQRETFTNEIRPAKTLVVDQDPQDPAEQQEKKKAEAIKQDDIKQTASSSLPETLARLGKYYLTDGNRYYHPDNKHKLAFVNDKHSLRTNDNSKRTIESMLSLAMAKNWRTIDVSGDRQFLRETWIQASALGLQVDGYRPTKDDLLELEARKTELTQATVEKAGEQVKSAPVSPVQASPGVEQKQDANVKSIDQPAAETLAKQDPPATAANQQAPQAIASDAPAQPANNAQDKFVELIDHGSAKYNFDPKEKDSYFIKYRDASNTERTVWGVDLERAVGEAKALPGNKILIENNGRQPVTVPANVLNEQGDVIGTKPIDTHRNEWSVKVDQSSKVNPQAIVSHLTNQANRNGAPDVNQAVLQSGVELAKEHLKGNERKAFLAHLSAATGTKISRGQPVQQVPVIQQELKQGVAR